jgi:hypothetical protein
MPGTALALSGRAKAVILISMSITAIVENGMIKLPAGVFLPDGTRVEIAAPDLPVLAPGADDPLYHLAELAEPMGPLTNEDIDAAIYGR